MVFSSGIRHGFDWDHLATVDSITRRVRKNNPLSKLVGVLFSLGHGLVLVLISLTVNSDLFPKKFTPWLETLGDWISILFLICFGLLTLWNILPYSSTLPTSIKNLLFDRLVDKKCNPLFIILIGALFALSFDTFTQVALFSTSVSAMTGYLFSTLLGIVFILGMMVSDSLNGFFVASLIQLADKKSIFISRSIGFAIASLSLTLGILELIEQLSP